MATCSPTTSQFTNCTQTTLGTEPYNVIRLYTDGFVTVTWYEPCSNGNAYVDSPSILKLTEKQRRKFLRLERRAGFRSYVGALKRTHAESPPPDFGDGRRKIDRWTMTVRRRPTNAR